MVNDKGKSKKSVNPKKKIKLNTTRRPTGIMIADEPPLVNINPRASLSATQSSHQSQNAPALMASRSGYTISAPIVAPSHECNIPSASSSQCNSLNTTSKSVGLSNLHLGSNGSEPNTPTTQHSNAQGPQPGDRDSTRRIIIEPVGYGYESTILHLYGL